jgi:hypothetical protein
MNLNAEARRRGVSAEKGILEFFSALFSASPRLRVEFAA